METAKILDYTKNITVVTLVLGILYLGSTRTWVWGKELEEEKARTASALADRDKWEKLALAGLQVAESAAVKKFDMQPPLHNAIPEVQEPVLSPKEVAERLDKVKTKVYPGQESVPLVDQVK